MTVEENEELHNDLNEHNLHAAIGYFIAAYSKIELIITVHLAILTKNSDFEAFHILTKGMDLRVKIERFRELCKPLSLIDTKSALDIRLDLVTSKICNLRNKLSHSAIDVPDVGFPELGLSSISAIHPEKRKNTETIHLDVLAHYSDWCEDFYQDILHLLPIVRKFAKLSIGHPHSQAPKEFHQHLEQLAHRAKLDKLRRTHEMKAK